MLPNIVVIGVNERVTERLGALFAPRGWVLTNFVSMREADRAMVDGRFNVVLALESLPDGRGYELSGRVAKRMGSLFVEVPLSESCLWLPVVQNGKKVLGRRAVGPMEIGLEIEHLADGCDGNGETGFGTAANRLASRRTRARTAHGFDSRPGATVPATRRKPRHDQS